MKTARQNGLLQPPPRMVEDLVAWAWGNVQAAQRNAPTPAGESPLRLGETRTKRLPFDLRGWKYGDRGGRLAGAEQKKIQEALAHIAPFRETAPEVYAQLAETFRQRLAESAPMLTVALTHSGSSGGFVSGLGMLHIEFGRLTTKADIEKIAAHELRHIAGDLLRKTAEKPPKTPRTFGLPSRKIQTPQWSQQTDPSAFAHIMDDTEFYTELADAIDELRHELPEAPEQRRALFRGATEGRNALEFFRVLQKHAPAKWKKAVSLAHAELLNEPTKPNPATARRTDPALWERIVDEVTAGDKGGRPGQWSARKAQLAVALYRQQGGGYIGPKSADNALAKWTREKWRTRSGRPSLVTGERYLPSKALAALSPQEYAATTRAKRAGMARGQQFVPQPESIAMKTAKYRKARLNPISGTHRSPKVKAFVRAFKQRRLDELFAQKGVRMDLVVDQNRDGVTLDIIEASTKGKGAGTFAMQALIALADEFGIRLYLYALPYQGSMSREDLVSFYEKFGFYQDYEETYSEDSYEYEEEDDYEEKGVNMVRDPALPQHNPRRSPPERIALKTAQYRKAKSNPVRRARRNPNYPNVSVYRGVLTSPEGRIPVKQIGKGQFSVAYLSEEPRPRVFLFTSGDVADKEILMFAHDRLPNNPHLPAVEQYGDTRDGKTVWTMPLYKAPLKKADNETAWKQYLALKRCWDALYKPRGVKSGYQVNYDVYECAVAAGVSPKLANALEHLINTAADYDEEYVFEFSPRNLATDAEGHLVLLDVLYHRRMLFRKLGAAAARGF